jgi:hypothetical protein
MEKPLAELLVRSLLGRVAELPDGFRLPEGRISLDEFNALRVLIGQEPVTDKRRDAIGSKHGAPEIVLDLSSLQGQGPSEEALRLCIDFGTAMSKAWATGKNIAQTVPLVLGRYAGIGDTLPVPSSIYISRGGRIFLGADAEKQHRQEIDQGHHRFRFDNLKRMLSEAEVGQDLYHVELPIGIDPMGSGLTRGDLLVLYLAWLTDIALQALADVAKTGVLPTEVSELRLRCVRRRFAIPCFAVAVDEKITSVARAVWAEDVLSRAILQAQVVADTLTGQWGALTVDRAKTVLNAVRDLEISGLPSVLASTAAVREPIAAGASLFNEELERTEHQIATLRRRYLLVIGAGAGTTDFALFEVFYNPELDTNRYALIGSTVRMSRIAGNAVDEVLRPLVFRACGIDPATGNPRSDEDFALIKTDLASQIRSIKQTLFREGKCSISLLPNVKGTIDLQDLTTEPSYQDLGGELKTACRAILEGLFPQSFIERLRVRNITMPIYVLLTGGSSVLPIIQDLGDSTMSIDGAQFKLEKVKDIPTLDRHTPARPCQPSRRNIRPMRRCSWWIRTRAARRTARPTKPSRARSAGRTQTRTISSDRSWIGYLDDAYRQIFDPSLLSLRQPGSCSWYLSTGRRLMLLST